MGRGAPSMCCDRGSESRTSALACDLTLATGDGHSGSGSCMATSSILTTLSRIPGRRSTRPSATTSCGRSLPSWHRARVRVRCSKESNGSMGTRPTFLGPVSSTAKSWAAFGGWRAVRGRRGPAVPLLRSRRQAPSASPQRAVVGVVWSADRRHRPGRRRGRDRNHAEGQPGSGRTHPSASGATPPRPTPRPARRGGSADRRRLRRPGDWPYPRARDLPGRRGVLRQQGCGTEVVRSRKARFGLPRPFLAVRRLSMVELQAARCCRSPSRWRSGPSVSRRLWNDWFWPRSGPVPNDASRRTPAGRRHLADRRAFVAALGTASSSSASGRVHPPVGRFAECALRRALADSLDPPGQPLAAVRDSSGRRRHCRDRRPGPGRRGRGCTTAATGEPGSRH